MKANIGFGVLCGALVTIALTAVLYLANQLAGTPFVPYDLFDWMARVLPGAIVTFGIDLMIDVLRALDVSVAGTAKTAERVMAVGQFLLLGTAAGVLFFVIARLRGASPDVVTGIVAAALIGLPMIAISIAIGGSTLQPVLVVLWLAVAFAAWGLAVRESYVRLYPEEEVFEAQPETGAASVPSTGPGRRQFLIRMGAATATITVAGSGLGYMMAQAARREIEADIAASMAHESEGSSRVSFPNANDPIMPAPGTRPEYTPLKDHYKVFLRSQPTRIDGETWTLPIMGLVENPVSLSILDIRSRYESRDQFVTLSCISGRVGTDLISTTQWTGVSVQDILTDVKPKPDAKYLYITSGDGFYESVSLDLINSDDRIMLCHSWDGNPLPIDHGFPLRIWLPDRYGMKQPKWITGIEVRSELTQGYWVERGWDAVARVESTSVIDIVADGAKYERDGQTFVPVGGIAFGGDRGISKVEVRVNRGPWQEAQLRAPLSETTWVIWRYDWPFESGLFHFEVRCQEGDGTPQIEEKRGNHPSGATGIHNFAAAI